MACRRKYYCRECGHRMKTKGFIEDTRVKVYTCINGHTRTINYDIPRLESEVIPHIPHDDNSLVMKEPDSIVAMRGLFELVERSYYS